MQATPGVALIFCYNLHHAKKIFLFQSLQSCKENS